MKVDKIIPNNWKEVVQGKKVILYNTGVGSLLHGREKRIEKMKWVFQVFKEHPEVVLWWRPHPLEVSTLKSMLPELEEQYMEVRQQYINENIGILDESADLNRAIAVSDAYYGAWSSVVELYKATNKPILFESNKVEALKATSFLPVALCIKNDDIWFIQANSNKLIKMNRVTYEVEEIISIPCEPAFRSRLCNYHIIDIGESLLLLLEKSEHIYEYKMQTGTVKIHRPEIGNYIFKSELVIEKNQKVLMFPHETDKILEYDQCTGMIRQKEFVGKNVKVTKCYDAVGSKIYMVDRGTNSLYCYDLLDGSNLEMHIGAENNQYWGVKKAKEYFILFHADERSITLWNEESGEIIKLTEFPEGYASWEDHAYFDVFERNGNIYIFPFYGNMVLEVDVKNKIINQVFDGVFFEADYNMNSEECSGSTYSYVGEYSGLIYAYSLIKNCWQVFNLDTMDMQEMFWPEIKEKEYRELLERLLDNNVCKNPFYEFEKAAICTLENYIKSLADNDEKYCCAECIDNDIGIRIYNFMMNRL